MKTISTNTLIYEYRITSAEMRSLEQNQRRILLLESDMGKPFLRGEVLGCGIECHATLSEVLLEFIMSCEGCTDPNIFEQYIQSFCDKVSSAIIRRFPEDVADVQLISSLECLLRSLDGEYTLPSAHPTGQYGLLECPICATSNRMGINRGVDKAHTTFFRLCDVTLQSITTKFSLLPADSGFEPGHSLTFTIEEIDPRSSRP